MRLRVVVVACALTGACTGANPAFDLDDEGADAGTQGAPTSTTRADESSAESSGDPTRSTTDETSADDGTGVDPDPGTCSVTPETKSGLRITPVTAEACPNEGLVHGPIVERDQDSFGIADCGTCDCPSERAPDWSVSFAQDILPDSLAVGECVAMYFDCDEALLPAARNILLMRGSADAPLLALAEGALPQGAGGWGPMPFDGRPCPTNECETNTELFLQFDDVALGESEAVTASVLIHEQRMDMDVYVINARYDPVACDQRTLWLAKPP